jgi:DnaJ-class molecular chaperone
VGNQVDGGKVMKILSIMVETECPVCKGKIADDFTQYNKLCKSCNGTGGTTEHISLSDLKKALEETKLCLFK